MCCLSGGEICPDGGGGDERDSARTVTGEVAWVQTGDGTTEINRPRN